MQPGLNIEKCAELATEYRRLAGHTPDNWVRADLLRSAQFYDRLARKLGAEQAVVPAAATDLRGGTCQSRG